MLLILGVLISSIVCNAQARLEGESIIGGVETKLNELKYHASLQFFNVDWCGGSIIDEQFFVTAAHCVIDGNDQFLIFFPFKVVAGINDLSDIDYKYKVEIEVDKIYVPAVYNRTKVASPGDIAVLRLKKKFDLGPKSNLTKLELPRSSEKKLTSKNSFVGTEPLVSGFGWDKVTLNPVKTEQNKNKFVEDGSSSGKLLKAKALVINNEECQNLYEKYVIHDSQICAKIIQHPEDVHQGICSGDSGSPLVLDNTLIGLVSFNYIGCNDNKRPAVYTRISAFISFINDAMEDRVTEEIRAQDWNFEFPPLGGNNNSTVEFPPSGDSNNGTVEFPPFDGSNNGTFKIPPSRGSSNGTDEFPLFGGRNNGTGDFPPLSGSKNTEEITTLSNDVTV